MNQAEDKPTLFKLCFWVGTCAWRRLGLLAWVAISMLFQILFEVLKPWPVLFLVDYILMGKVLPGPWLVWVERLPGAPAAPALIGWTIGSTILIFLMSWATNLANGLASISLGQRMVYDLAAELFAKLQQLSLRFHAHRSVGDNIRRIMADSNCVAVIATEALLPVLSALISLVVMFGIMWQVAPGLTMVALAVVPYMVWVFYRYARPMLELSYRQQDEESEIYSLYEESLSAMPLVQSFGREALNQQTQVGIHQHVMETTMALTRVQLKFKVLMGLATALGTAAILLLASDQALNGQMSIGIVILFLSYLASLYAPIETVMYTTATIQSAGGSALRVWELLQTPQEVTNQPGALIPARTDGLVRFDHLVFGYEKDQPVLQDINLEIQPGQTVALVGASGAGKSTLASMLVRFFDPQEGVVSLDGVNLKDLDLHYLRSQVGLVLQEPFLFPMTIADNIAYGKPRASMTDIKAAARAANAHEFIQRLPQGYQTQVGEGGGALSGGERQRISIARALLKNAPVLILDEPTSALDVDTERDLLQAWKTLTKDRTTLLIAHRFSTIRSADLIVVLNNGQIAEQGNHEELMALNGLYRRLHDRQSGASSAPPK